jgi:plastocyanin
MPVRSITFLVMVLAGLALACEGNHPQPIAPSALQSGSANVGSGAPLPVGTASAAAHAITLFDACDPATFNAAIGPGACVRSGGVTFQNFVEQLRRHHSAGAWHFAPVQVTMRAGQMLEANNRGGEAHTFTEVEEFGGGTVPFLNNLVGLTEMAPECSGAVMIPSGGSSSETEDEPGVEKYQCCIHPWMRAEVRVIQKQ